MLTWHALLLLRCSSYGCMSGKAPQFPWAQWVCKDLSVRGFNLRKWLTNNKKKARTASCKHTIRGFSLTHHFFFPFGSHRSR